MEDIAFGRYDLPFDHSMDIRRPVALIQSKQPLEVFRVSLGAPGVVTQVIHPGRRVICFRPAMRVLKVPHERPSLSPVTEGSFAEREPRERAANYVLTCHPFAGKRVEISPAYRTDAESA